MCPSWEKNNQILNNKHLKFNENVHYIQNDSMSLFLSIFMKYFLPFKIGLLLSVDQLKDEISILERSLQVRNQLQALRNYEQGKNSVYVFM